MDAGEQASSGAAASPFFAYLLSGGQQDTFAYT
jgi:hypothetical protein